MRWVRSSGLLREQNKEKLKCPSFLSSTKKCWASSLCPLLLSEVGSFSCSEANPSSSLSVILFSPNSWHLWDLAPSGTSPSLHFQSFPLTWHLPRDLQTCSGPPDPLSDCSVSLHHSTCHCCHFLTTHSFLLPCTIWFPPPLLYGNCSCDFSSSILITKLNVFMAHRKQWERWGLPLGLSRALGKVRAGGRAHSMVDLLVGVLSFNELPYPVPYTQWSVHDPTGLINKGPPAVAPPTCPLY